MEATYFFTICCLALFGVSSRLTGIWFSPLSHYALRWLFLVFLVEINLLGYDDISSLTWWVVAGSFLSFSCGALVPMLHHHGLRGKHEGKDIQEGLRSSVDRRKFLRSIIVLFILGTFVLVVFLYNVNKSIGIVNFLVNGQTLRLEMNQGDVPVGFHYLYIMEMVGPLCFLYFLLFRKETPKWLFFVMFLSIASLLFTTGRTNMIKSLVWIVYILIYFNIQHLSIVKFTKIIGGLSGVAVGLFFLLGLWTSETFESTDIYRVGNHSGPAASLLLPYFYMSVELPVLDKLLHDPDIHHEWGKYTFLPIVKVAQLFFRDFKVPSHIGEFYDTPFPANIATYLDLMYKDFWFIGPIVLPALLGFVCSYFFIRLLFGRVNLALFMINTVLALTVFSSISAANYMKPSYWFQVVLIVVLSKYCRPPSSVNLIEKEIFK